IGEGFARRAFAARDEAGFKGNFGLPADIVAWIVGRLLDHHVDTANLAIREFSVARDCGRIGNCKFGATFQEARRIFRIERKGTTIRGLRALRLTLLDRAFGNRHIRKVMANQIERSEALDWRKGTARSLFDRTHHRALLIDAGLYPKLASGRD